MSFGYKAVPAIYVPHLTNKWPMEAIVSDQNVGEKNETGYTSTKLYSSLSFHEATMLAVMMVVGKYFRINKFHVEHHGFKPTLVLGMSQQDYVNSFRIKVNSPISNVPHPLLGESFFIYQLHYVHGDGWKNFSRPTGFFAQTYQNSEMLGRNMINSLQMLVFNTMQNFSVGVENEYGNPVQLLW